MTQHFGSSVINKADAVEMKIVSTLLGQLGILDQAAFMANYATTIGTRIYLPFTPGVPVGEWDLFSQLVVCAHEHQHVFQAQTLGLVTYGARYIASASTRADYEAEAYRSAFELGWWHSRTMPDPGAVAQLLTGYGVSETDIEVVATTLREAAETVERGAILNHATEVALEWLNMHAPELRAVGP
jgi:hypothetical protein